MTGGATGVLIIGAGGFGRETIELVNACRRAGESLEVCGVCDDDDSLHGTTVLGVPVVGGTARVHDHPDAKVVVTIGNPRAYDVRRRIVERLDVDPDRYIALVHPTAAVSSSSSIGCGSVVHAFTVLTADATIGAHVAVMPHVVVTHDVRIGDFATIGAGAMFAGGVVVEEGAYVGSGAMVRENLTIGAGALVGMGAVVTRSVPPGETWTGNPARPIERG